MKSVHYEMRCHEQVTKRTKPRNSTVRQNISIIQSEDKVMHRGEFETSGVQRLEAETCHAYHTLFNITMPRNGVGSKPFLPNSSRKYITVSKEYKTFTTFM